MRDVEVKAIIREDRFDAVMRALREIPDLPGVTVSRVGGFGRRRSVDPTTAAEHGRTSMVKLETVVPASLAAAVVEVIRRAACTGRAGDGKIFVIPVEQTIRIRNDESGSANGA